MRLTMRSGGTAYWKTAENTGYRPDDVCFRSEVERLDKLAAYEDAEEQGRLVVLPCKVGDTVYFLQSCLNNYFVNYGSIIAFHVYGFYVTVEVNTRDAFNPFITLDVSAFGKTVFLTREEAEAALKGGRDDGT